MPYDDSYFRGNKLFRILVRLIYLVLKVCGEPAELGVASVLHKANFKDNNRSDATLWWVKHCGSNREAVCLSAAFNLVNTTRGVHP